MPALTNDIAAFDPIEYYTKQLPLDLARLTALRDELAKRQGALTAVEETHKDREDAAVVLETAKRQAAKILADAKAADAEAKTKAGGLDAREALLTRTHADIIAAVTAREEAVTGREYTVAAREASAAVKEQSLDAMAAKLEAEKNAFNTKVDAFQNMAAQLKA